MEHFIEFDASTGTRTPASDAAQVIQPSQIEPTHYPPNHGAVSQAQEPVAQTEANEAGNPWTDNAASIYWKGQAMQSIVAMLQLARLAGLSYGYYSLIENGGEIADSLVAIRTPVGLMQFLVEPNWLAAIQQQIEVPPVGTIGYRPDLVNYQTSEVIESLKMVPAQSPQVAPPAHNQQLLATVMEHLDEALYPKVRFTTSCSLPDLMSAALDESRASVQQAMQLIAAA